MKPRRSPGLVSTADNLIDWIKQHGRILAGNISFGTGTNGDTVQNIDGFWAVGVVSPVSANTDFAVPYSLPGGRTAIAYDVKRLNKAAKIYDGVTPWTSTTIYLRSDSSSTTLTLFIH